MSLAAAIEYDNDTEDFCDDHAVSRSTCGCPWDIGPRGLAARILDRAGLASLPEPEPLIADTLDRRTVAMLAGYWGTGKSFIALDWCASIATDRKWQGRATESGRVLYIASEGAYGLHGRLNAWESAWGRKIDPERFHVLPVPVQLTNASQFRELRAIVADTQPDFIAVDTVARCAVGLDENSSKDMGMFLDALYRLRDETPEGTVLAVHHTGKDRTTIRGSSALESGVETCYQIEGDAGLLKLERTKRKDGPLHDVHKLRLLPIEGTGSVVVESVRLSADTTAGVRTLMSAYMSTFDSTGATKADLRTIADMPSASYHRALNTAVSEGLLINTGSDKRPFYVLGDINE